MLATTTLPLALMTAAQMRAVHNLLAQERGRPTAPRTSDRAILGKEIALLRTYPKTPKVTVATVKVDRRRNRAAPLRDAILKELVKIKYYENSVGVQITADEFERGNFEGDWTSVGFSYKEIAKAIPFRVPFAKVRGLAHLLRSQALDNGVELDFPEARPRQRIPAPKRKKSNVK